MMDSGGSRLEETAATQAATYVINLSNYQNVSFITNK